MGRMVVRRGFRQGWDHFNNRWCRWFGHKPTSGPMWEGTFCLRRGCFAWFKPPLKGEVKHDG